MSSIKVFNALYKISNSALSIKKLTKEEQFNQLQEELISLGFAQAHIDLEVNQLNCALYEINNLDVVKLKNELNNKLVNADLNFFEVKNYAKTYAVLLSYARLMYKFEKNGIPEEHAYKLAIIFEDHNQAIHYLKVTLNNHSDNQQIMHNASNYALPKGDYDLKIWRKLCAKFAAQPGFLKNIFPSANELELFIKEKSSKFKLKNTQINAIAKQTKLIEKTNNSLKKLTKRHGSLSLQQKHEHQRLIELLSNYQNQLTNMHVPFNEQLTHTALKAFKATKEVASAPVLRYFYQNGLTEENYQKFISLTRKNNYHQIPDVKINGEDLGYPGFYIINVNVVDELQAARAACLGKLTDCCQSLSGETGESCVIHGLTSDYGGFYVLCKGDINQPKVSDVLYGQCWAWRSQSGAIIFDSIEAPSNVKQHKENRDMVCELYHALGKELVVQKYTHKVACGEYSGISQYLGNHSLFNELEYFKDYNGYSDSQEQQKIIYDGQCPYYYYGLYQQATLATEALIEQALKNKETPLVNQQSFAQMLNWAILERKQKLINKIIDMFTQQDQVIKINHFINELNAYIYESEKIALEKISYIHARDIYGRVPLMHAAARDNTQACIALLAQGAAINSRDKTWKTPLISAVEAEAIEACQLLLEHHAQIDLRDELGETALLNAVISGNYEICQLLIKNGAQVNVSDNAGETLLMFAAKEGDSELCELLIEAGAQVNAESMLGESALLYALEHGDKEVYELLVNFGADVNFKNKDNHTPLMIAARNGLEDICIELLEKGAKVTDERTVLLYAINQQLNHFCLKLLEKDLIISEYGINLLKSLNNKKINNFFDKAQQQKENQQWRANFSYHLLNKNPIFNYMQKNQVVDNELISKKHIDFDFLEEAEEKPKKNTP
jgi:ankyrin repeat protein